MNILEKLQNSKVTKTYRSSKLIKHTYEVITKLETLKNNAI